MHLHIFLPNFLHSVPIFGVFLFICFVFWTTGHLVKALTINDAFLIQPVYVEGLLSMDWTNRCTTQRSIFKDNFSSPLSLELPLSGALGKKSFISDWWQQNVRIYSQIKFLLSSVLFILSRGHRYELIGKKKSKRRSSAGICDICSCSFFFFFLSFQELLRSNLLNTIYII